MCYGCSLGLVKNNFSELLRVTEQFYLARSKKMISHWREDDGGERKTPNENVTTIQQTEKLLLRAHAMSHRFNLAYRKCGASCSFYPTCLGVAWLIWVAVKMIQEEVEDEEEGEEIAAIG